MIWFATQFAVCLFALLVAGWLGWLVGIKWQDYQTWKRWRR